MNENKPFRNVKRREFGHGQNMNPGDKEYNRQTAYRGFPYSPAVGRDYESNAGYREHYDRATGRRGEGEAQSGGRSRENAGGQHKGKGPKSYRRTDERILDDLNDRMCDNPYLDASDIDVSVQDGEVVLSGYVEDRNAKRLAEEIGESVTGVSNVENRLRVRIRGI